GHVVGTPRQTTVEGQGQVGVVGSVVLCHRGDGIGTDDPTGPGEQLLAGLVDQPQGPGEQGRSTRGPRVQSRPALLHGCKDVFQSQAVTVDPVGGAHGGQPQLRGQVLPTFRVEPRLVDVGVAVT